MFQEFIKEQNECDLFLHPTNNNLVFLTNFIKLELEFFNFGKMEFEINEDLSFITDTYPSGMASSANQVVICRVTKQFNLLSEKYKTGSSNIISGFWTGLVSNIKAATKNNNTYSSQIYLIRKK